MTKSVSPFPRAYLRLAVVLRSKTRCFSFSLCGKGLVGINVILIQIAAPHHHRKSGGSPPKLYANQSAKSNRNISFSSQVRSHGKPGQVGELGAPVQFRTWGLLSGA